MNHIYGSGYMYLCASYYQSNYPEQEYQFFNRGISGNTLNDLKNRWKEDALAIHADVVSVLIGTNDVNEYLGKKTVKLSILFRGNRLIGVCWIVCVRIIRR